MQNESALLLRLHEQQQLSAPLLLINPVDHPSIYHQLDLIGVLYDNYQNYTRWQQSDVPASFACHLPDKNYKEQVDITVVLFLPKGKNRLLAQLQLLAGRVPVGTRLVVIGAIDTGIKSAGKKMLDYCEQVQKTDAARHCQAWSGYLIERPKIELESLFTRWPLTFAGKTLDISSLPGVFSDGRLDTGSQLLIETLRQNLAHLPVQGNVLDFGCGSGVLSTAINLLLPDTNITAVDNDAFALNTADRTFQTNTLGAQIKPTASPTDLKGRYSLVVSNPPFHQGTSQSTIITNALIKQLANLLEPKGQAWIVANRFLNYEESCKAAGLNVCREAENRAYKTLKINHHSKAHY